VGRGRAPAPGHRGAAGPRVRNFQAPRFYASLGYRVVFELAAFPHGIVKFTMLREIGGGDASA
jgi:hypothetical protein